LDPETEAPVLRGFVHTLNFISVSSQYSTDAYELQWCWKNSTFL